MIHNQGNGHEQIIADGDSLVFDIVHIHLHISHKILSVEGRAREPNYSGYCSHTLKHQNPISC